MADIGRYNPRTAQWVIDQIRLLQRSMAGLVTRKEFYSSVGISHDQAAIQVRNVDAQDAPAFAVMQVVDTQNPTAGVRDYCYLHVQRPSDQYGRDGFYLVNGPTIIPADEYGVAYGVNQCVAIAEGSGTVGDRYIPKIGSWKLDKDASGQWIFAGADDVDADGYRFFSDGGEKIMWFTTPSGGIPAYSGGVYGSAVCTLKRVALSGTAASLVTSLDCAGAANTHRVYNAGMEAVEENEDIQAVLINGTWWANWEEC